MNPVLMKPLRRTKKSTEQPVCEMSEWLKRQGFVRADHETLKLGDLYVLKPRNDRPWWTVQKRSSSTVRWFVDFPLQVPASALQRFIESV